MNKPSFRHRNSRASVLSRLSRSGRATVLALIAQPFLFAGAHHALHAAEVEKDLAAVAGVDESAAANKKASESVRQLQALPSNQVGEVLAAFNGATVRGKNWLRALSADVSDNGEFPKAELLAFFRDRSNDSDARYVAYQLLVGNDQSTEAELLSNAESDPSLPVRFLKIRNLIAEASRVSDSDKARATAILRKVVSDGRSPKQLEDATKMLKDLGVEIDLANELGMIRRWWIIGPFDNTDSQDFDTVYAPEHRYLDGGNPVETDASGASKSDEGKHGEVTWQRVESDDSLGMVDLNGPFANEKDAAAYAFVKFRVDSQSFDPDAQVRIGCITANKIWVNGKLVSSNEVYHSGTRIDQYVDACRLIDGENTILVKVMQNAQTQPWAQDWEFQFRLTRPDGSAIKTILAE